MRYDLSVADRIPLLGVCRWATEDPNPVQKVAEKRRIETQGKVAIAGQIDGNMVEAVQAIGALEEGREEDFYPIALEDGDDEEAGRSGKRLRLENGSAATGTTVGDAGNAASLTTTKKNGILGGEALDNLLYFAELAKKQAAEVKRAGQPAAPKTGMGALGGYGSDSEED